MNKHKTNNPLNSSCRNQFLLLIVAIIFSACSHNDDGCRSGDENCSGCTDSTAFNYDSYATSDDGSCYYHPGCKDVFAENYDSQADFDDGSCIYDGCTDQCAVNYDSDASVDDGSCYYTYGDNHGKLTTWLNNKGVTPPVEIKIGVLATETLNETYSTTITCGSTSGSVSNNILSEGYYVYTASSVDGTEWSGEVYIPCGQCVSLMLYENGCAEGNAFENNLQFGSIMVWSSFNSGSDIMVILNGIIPGKIISVFTEEPVCGTKTAANFCGLEPGNYTITASSGIYNWPTYTIAVFAGQCSRFELK